MKVIGKTCFCFDNRIDKNQLFIIKKMSERDINQHFLKAYLSH